MAAAVDAGGSVQPFGQKNRCTNQADLHKPYYSLREIHTNGRERVLHTIHCKAARVRNASLHHFAIQDVDHVVLCLDVSVRELSQAADCLAQNTNNACAPSLTGPARSTNNT